MPSAVVLTALDVEFQAVRTHLTDLQDDRPPQGTAYERGKFVANGQEWEVGIVEVGAGNAGAAVETERAITYFQPDILFFVGIAGGIKDVAIGDVVVATDVYGYESGKAGEGEQFSTRPKVGMSAYALVQEAISTRRKGEWLQRLSNIPVPQPRVHVAPIAAGEKVIASRQSDIFHFLRASYNDAIAVEMEGFGFLSAAFAYPNIKAIVIRGISDLIEGKNDDAIEPEQVRQEKASHHASAFAFEMLAKLEPKSVSEKTGNLQLKVNQLSSDELISDIASKDPLTSANAVQLLKKRQDIQAILPAIIAIRSSSPIQIEAIKTVLRIYPEQSAKLLMENLNKANTNWYLASSTVDYFDPIHGSFCEAELVRNLTSTWWTNLARLSVQALGQCGSIVLGGQLRELLTYADNTLDSDKNGKLGFYVVTALTFFFVRSNKELLRYSSDNLRDELIRQYHYNEWASVNGFMLSHFLVQYCDGRHIDILIRDWLSSDEFFIVEIATEILGYHQIIRAVNPLIKVMEKCQETNVVFACSSALGHIGTPEALEYLLAAPENSAKGLGRRFVLDKIEPSLFRRIVIEHLDRSQDIDYLVLRAIGLQYAQEFTKVLQTELEGADPLKRGVAALALARLKSSVNKEYLMLSLEQSSNELERILMALAILVIDPLTYKELETQLRRDLSKNSYYLEVAIQTDIVEVLMGTHNPEAIELANAWKPFYRVKEEKHSSANPKSIINMETQKPLVILDKSQLLENINQKQIKLSELDQHLETDISPSLKEVLDWISTSSIKLAQRIVSNALEDCPNLKQVVKSNSSLEKRINWEFEKYLQNISNSLRTKHRELLDQPPISPFTTKEGSLFTLEERTKFKAEEGRFYTLALQSLKDVIPKRYCKEIKLQMIDYINNLRDNLPQ